jgi:hypothetical protein
VKLAAESMHREIDEELPQSSRQGGESRYDL